jgi:hypothetical protein
MKQGRKALASGSVGLEERSSGTQSLRTILREAMHQSYGARLLHSVLLLSRLERDDLV